MIAVRYTEGVIRTQLASDVITLGTRTFGLATDISGDSFLLAKEINVPGFLGASQGRFESDSDYSTHIFSEIVKELPIPVFSLAFTESWGTLTLGGPDPIFHSKPITWINTLKGEAGWVTHLSSHVDIYAKGADPKTTPDSEIDYVRTDLDRVWFDSGTTYIWGDERAVKPLNEWMGADPLTGQVNCSTIPSLGSIVFSIGGNEDNPLLRLELSPAEYIIGKSTSHRCFTALNVVESSKNHWIFGLHVLKAFYTIYHYEYGIIGIAPYNVTATNPAGKAVVPGIHKVLDQEVKESLQRMPSSATPSKMNDIPAPIPSTYKIRPATEQDLPQINGIVNHEIAVSINNFNYGPRSEQDGFAWFRATIAGGYPIFVATTTVAETEEEIVAGYSSLGSFRQKDGYRFTAEYSLYIHHEHRQRGLGKRLLKDLLIEAKRRNFHSII
ncbi:hypothetical protein BG015_000124, partial [Linnemannia schmuckeri]